MTDFETRFLVESDHDEWATLFAGYADFYGMELTPDVATRVWQWLHDPAHVLEGLIVRERGGVAVGIGHFRAMPRPLGGCEIGFLDDMFVAPEHRGSGAADALFAKLKDVAVRRGWPSLRWITQHFNERGRAFYDRYTGGPSDFIMYQWKLD